MESPKDSPLSPKRTSKSPGQTNGSSTQRSHANGVPAAVFPATPVDLSHVCSKDAAASSDPSEMHNRMEDRTLAKFTHMHMYVYIYTWWLIKILSCRNGHSSPGAGFTFTKLSGTPWSFAGPMLGPILGNNAPYEDSVVICQTIIDLFHDSLVNMQLASRNIRVNHT